MAKKKKTSVTSKRTKLSQVKRHNIKSNKRGGGNQPIVAQGKVKRKAKKTTNVSAKCTGARFAHEAAQAAGFGYKSKKRQKLQQYEEKIVEKEQPIEEEEEEEDEPGEDFEEEDLEYIKSISGQFLSSIEESDTHDLPKSRKNKHKENTPATFELEPRQIDKDPRLKMKALLPIKDAQGLEYRWEEKRKLEEDDVDAEGNDGEKKPELLPTLSTVELLEHRREKLTKKRQRIATLASIIQQDPEKNVFKLKELVAMLRVKDPDLRVTVPKLAMVSLCELFKDIAPGYMIRDLEEKEKGVQFKKEVKARRTFETALLSQYRDYLQFLEKTIHEIRKNKKQINREIRQKEEDPSLVTLEIPMEIKSAMAEIATRCMCSLLNNLFHFNYRTNIITVVVSLMTNKNKNVSDWCCTCIKQLFRDDIYGEGAVDAVRFITRLTKAKRYNVDPKVLDTFLSLKIKETNLNNPDIDKRRQLEEKKNKMRRLSRSQKRFNKRMDRLDKELLATEASENKKRRLKLHTEIIQSVFATYFRILKFSSGSCLLPSVLEGLAKFAHLINLEFFDDLVKALHHLIDTGTLSHRESLHCVLTAFQILSGQGDVLNIDPSKFYTTFYVTLLAVNGGISSADASVVIECLEVMVYKRHKHLSIQQVLAYIKRLCTQSLQCLPNASLSYLCTVKDAMKRHPKSDALLDSNSGGSGVFMPELSQPEHCHAHNTSLWELQLLKRHYHKVVRNYANYVSRGFPTTGAASLDIEMIRKTPQHLLEEYDPTLMQFNPALPPKTLQISKKKAKLQLQALSDRTLLQEEFQQSVTEIMSKETDNWADIDFTQQKKKSRTIDDEMLASKNETEAIKATHIGASKRKNVSSVSKPKVKKFKGQLNNGIIRANGK